MKISKNSRRRMRNDERETENETIQKKDEKENGMEERRMKESNGNK